jgi:hypothetical protein
MTRKLTFFASFVTSIVFASAMTLAQGPTLGNPAPLTEADLSAQEKTVQEPTVPQRPQTAPADQPAEAPRPLPSQPVPEARPSGISAELLIGKWDINVDSYLDARLARKGKYEHPAKIEYARNLLKANGMNIRLDFQADGCIDVDKTYCGECESKTGSWCVTCVEGQDMTVLVKGHHGWTRRNLELVVCDDLHIRVISPTEIAGIYERVPDAVQPVGASPQPTEAGPPRPANAPPTAATIRPKEGKPPAAPPAEAYEDAPTEVNTRAQKVVPQRPASPGVTDEVAP